MMAQTIKLAAAPRFAAQQQVTSSPAVGPRLRRLAANLARHVPDNAATARTV
jgi:hypothetical protein